MGGQETQPLTPEEAKARLRQAASHLGIGPWVRKQPIDAMLLGVFGGFLIGQIPRLWKRLRRLGLGPAMLNRLM